MEINKDLRKGKIYNIFLFTFENYSKYDFWWNLEMFMHKCICRKCSNAVAYPDSSDNSTMNILNIHKFYHNLTLAYQRDL